MRLIDRTECDVFNGPYVTVESKGKQYRAQLNNAGRVLFVKTKMQDKKTGEIYYRLMANNTALQRYLFRTIPELVS